MYVYIYIYIYTHTPVPSPTVCLEALSAGHFAIPCKTLWSAILVALIPHPSLPGHPSPATLQLPSQELEERPA